MIAIHAHACTQTKAVICTHTYMSTIHMHTSALHKHTILLGVCFEVSALVPTSLPPEPHPRDLLHHTSSTNSHQHLFSLQRVHEPQIRASPESPQSHGLVILHPSCVQVDIATRDCLFMPQCACANNMDAECLCAALIDMKLHSTRQARSLTRCCRVMWSLGLPRCSFWSSNNKLITIMCRARTCVSV